MKRVLACLLAAVFAACGGAIEGQNDNHKNKSDPPLCSSSQQSCSQGDSCLMIVPGCPGEPSSEISCACADGYFACPDIGRACPAPEPPTEPCGFAGRVSNGEACSAKGVTCDALEQSACYPPIP